MNNPHSPNNNQHNTSGFKVRRSSMTRREAERHVMSSEHPTTKENRQVPGAQPDRSALSPKGQGDARNLHRPTPSNRTTDNRSSDASVREPASRQRPSAATASQRPPRTAQAPSSPRSPRRGSEHISSPQSTSERQASARPTASPPSTESTDEMRAPHSTAPKASSAKPPRQGRQHRAPAPPSTSEHVAEQATQGAPSKPKRRSFVQRMEEAEAKRPQHRAKNDFIKPTDVVRIKGSYDRLFLILVIILTLFGIIMDFSASYAYAYSRYGDSFYFVKRQVLWAVVGMVGLFVAMHFDYRWLRKVTVPTFIGVILLLVLVLVYGVASGVAQRWIQVGPVTIQPSELMKFALVFMLALYVARNQDRITNYRNFRQSSLYGMFIPAAIVGVACLLIALEKHFSGTIIVFMIGMVIIFAAGARKFWFFLAGGGAMTLIAIAITFVPYARERIDMLLNPENYSPTGKIWQTLQGLYAVGSGGIFGVGLGNSRQKHLYVSQPQNDFIFSIICEELGFAGALLLIVLFMLLIWRGFVIALKAPDTFSSLVVIGLISKVAIQTILNIAVVTNLIPNTGISLPFFSYGGTALVTQLAEMGIILSISRYSYQRNDL